MLEIVGSLAKASTGRRRPKLSDGQKAAGLPAVGQNCPTRPSSDLKVFYSDSLQTLILMAKLALLSDTYIY